MLKKIIIYTIVLFLLIPSFNIYAEELNTVEEEEIIISDWAKPEVEKAIELGFVPITLRENYKRNITRGEFSKLAMFFLSIQYGYPGVTPFQSWSPRGKK